MNPHSRNAIAFHAEETYPLECCGLLALVNGEEVYFPLANTAPDGNDSFRIAPADWATVEEQGEVIAVVHSHPDYAAKASQADEAGCIASGLPWYIQEVRNGVSGALERIDPGPPVPLVGRQFFHGTLDCLQIILDYYKREKGIDLGQYAREDGWWEAGKDYYRELLPQAGFYPVEDLRDGDVILMQVRSPVPNHAGIYLANGTLKTEECYPQPGVVLHHLYGRLSRRDNYGGYWRDVTVSYWRHKNAS